MHLDKLPITADPGRTARLIIRRASLARCWGLWQSSSRQTSAWVDPSAVSHLRQCAHPRRSCELHATEDIAPQKLSTQALLGISGGGPGIMNSATRGVFRQGPERWFEYPAAARAKPPTPIRTSARPSSIFSRASHVRKFAAAYSSCPAALQLDELFEALTLVQTGKIAPIPIILVGRVLARG